MRRTRPRNGTGNPAIRCFYRHVSAAARQEETGIRAGPHNGRLPFSTGSRAAGQKHVADRFPRIRLRRVLRPTLAITAETSTNALRKREKPGAFRPTGPPETLERTGPLQTRNVRTARRHPDIRSENARRVRPSLPENGKPRNRLTTAWLFSPRARSSDRRRPAYRPPDRP